MGEIRIEIESSGEREKMTDILLQDMFNSTPLCTIYVS